MKRFFGTLAILVLAALTIMLAPSSASAEDCTPTIVEGWYTESDDAAPTIDGTNLVFTAPGGQAVGLRTAVSFPLTDLEGGTSFTDVFHERYVVDVDGEPFGAGNWRNDYLSLTFVDDTIVWVAGLNEAHTVAEVQALYTGTITSYGFHMDSNAEAGTSYTLVDSGLVTECEVVVPPTEEPVVTPPVEQPVEEPVVVEPVVTEPVAEATPTLAETGVKEDLIITLSILVAAFGGLGGLAVWVSRRAAARG